MTESKLIRINEVMDRVGCCRAQVYKLIHTEGFPKPIQLSKRMRAWRVPDVDDWIASRETADIQTSAH